jgi:outer membrane protein TolC
VPLAAASTARWVGRRAKALVCWLLSAILFAFGTIGMVEPAQAAPPWAGEAVAAPSPEDFPSTTPATGGGRQAVPVAKPTWNGSDQPSVEMPAPPKMAEPLPINLATALRLSDARPLTVAIAQTGVEQAEAELRQAQVLWLPNLDFGTGYFHHDGLIQDSSGRVFPTAWSNLSLGGGVTMSFGVTDALFAPLAARRVLNAREWDVQTARNDALLAVATAYFDVEQARGRLAGARDTVTKAEDLVRRVTSLARNFVPADEVDRVRAQTADLQEAAITAEADWRIASARLTRVLRLNPSATVIPLESPHLRITVISQGCTVDDLIPVGLRNRPELAAQQSLVEATIQLLRAERVRPLLPSVVLEGAGPDNVIEGGMFAGGLGNSLNTSGGRFDMGIGFVWTLNNLGLGNRASVRRRAADQQRALLELFDVQDRVAEDVARAYAQVEAANQLVRQAETGLKEAALTFRGNLTGIGQPKGVGDMLQLVNRPQEAVAALQELGLAYNHYFTAVADYNRAQFQLFHALGFPSQTLACQPLTGQIAPVDANRPAMRGLDN